MGMQRVECAGAVGNGRQAKGSLRNCLEKLYQGKIKFGKVASGKNVNLIDLTASGLLLKVAMGM